jgi:hypothetical protein
MLPRLISQPPSLISSPQRGGNNKWNETSKARLKTMASKVERHTKWVVFTHSQRNPTDQRNPIDWIYEAA